MSCGRAERGILITDMLASYSVELIPLDLTNNHAFYGISSDVLKHGNKSFPPIALRYFDLKMEFLIVFLISMKTLMKPQKT